MDAQPSSSHPGESPALQGQGPLDPAVPAAAPPADPDLEELRQILAAPDRVRAAELAARVEELEHRTSNPERLVAAISPLMGDILRRKIQEGRDEMIEALYPIIGQLIGRAVAEAVRDLVRAIDVHMRTSLDFKAL
ncbi:MAG: hypothetical protein ACUVS6_05690 [Anaerolineae bacterium]